MKLTPNSFFDGKFIEVNLNDYLTSQGCIDASKLDLVQAAVNKLGTHTFGGYGENRQSMFKGTYLENTGTFYHLGIDINVAKMTAVRCPFDASIIDRFIDPDTDVGWGGRIILEPDNDGSILVIGHLEPALLPDRLRFFKKGEILGRVGTWPTNGNVFEHIHIQCLLDANDDTFDGYGKLEDLKRYPNPFDVEY